MRHPIEDFTDELQARWNARQAWAPAALLAVFQILGCNYEDCRTTSFYVDGTTDFDIFTKYDFKYKSAVATVKVGKGVKSEGDLIVSGTKGYVYVPAPWWKMDYFEVRYENPADNRRYFYQLDGEGIRNELVVFTRLLSGCATSYVRLNESTLISSLTARIQADNWAFAQLFIWNSAFGESQTTKEHIACQGSATASV